MTTFERRQQLMEILRKQPGIRVPELADALNVSQGTIRNDLDALEEEGLVQRVHGGAALFENLQPQSPSFGARSKKNAPAKQVIARWAAQLVQDGDSILLDASTTVYYLTRFLQDKNRLRVVTNGIEAARALAKNPTNTVILLGGVINQDGSSLTGPMAEQLLHDLYIQTAFVSCSGFTPEIGLTEVHLNQAQLKIKMVGAANQVIALVDSDKIGKVDLTPFARADQVTQLYTDQALSEAWVDTLRRAGIPFTVCGENQASVFSQAAREQRRYRIGFANLSERLPFAVDVRKSIERAAEQAGNIDLVVADNHLDPGTALAAAKRFLEQDLDLVIEYQIDEQMGNRIMTLFRDAGIPVIAVDIPMIGATYYGVDNYRSGQLAGVALGEWVRDHWHSQYDRVIVLEEPRAGALPATRIRSQLEGFESVLGPIPEEKRLTLISGNTAEISERAVRSVLKKNSDLHRLAFICFNDDAAIGALEAARKLGREQDTAIVGQGADRRVCAELAKPGSRIIGSTAYHPEKYGEGLIPLALRILRGEPVPPAVYMDHSFISASADPVHS